MGHRASRVRTESQTNRRYGMRRIGAIALVLSTGLACAMSAQAKPKHQPLKCKAGYTRGTVRIAKRVHGRIVRRHGRIVYIKVQRCVKTPKPKPSSPAPPAVGTPTTPTTPQPPGTTTTTRRRRPRPPHPRRPRTTSSWRWGISRSLRAVRPASSPRLRRSHRPSIPLPSSCLATTSTTRARTASTRASYDLTWGRDFNSIVHPVPGNHEYLTSGAAGYFQYFGEHGVTTGMPTDHRRLLLVQPRQLAHRLAQLQLLRPKDARTLSTAARRRPRCRGCSPIWRTNPSACVLAMWHHPLFSYGWTLGDPGRGAAVDRPLQRPRGRRAQRARPLYERYAQQDPSGTATTSGIREFVVGTGGESLNGLHGSTPPANLQAQ